MDYWVDDYRGKDDTGRCSRDLALAMMKDAGLTLREIVNDLSFVAGAIKALRKNRQRSAILVVGVDTPCKTPTRRDTHDRLYNFIR